MNLTRETVELLPERRIIEVLEGSEPQGFEGVVWRHMFGARPVDTPNTGGARWNPPDCETLYTALTRDTALAEGNYASEAYGIPPRVQRYLYQIRVSLNAVADLTAASTLEALGLSADDISSPDHTACRKVGGAAAWMGRDGILVPSARAKGTNLIVFPWNGGSGYRFEEVGTEAIATPE